MNEDIGNYDLPCIKECGMYEPCIKHQGCSKWGAVVWCAKRDRWVQTEDPAEKAYLFKDMMDFMADTLEHIKELENGQARKK